MEARTRVGVRIRLGGSRLATGPVHLQLDKTVAEERVWWLREGGACASEADTLLALQELNRQQFAGAYGRPACAKVGKACCGNNKNCPESFR